MSLGLLSLESGETHKFSPGHNAVWVQTGAISIQEKTHAKGDGFYCNDASATLTGAVELLVFAVTVWPTDGGHILLSCEFERADEAVLRLDQVSFPANARAYRHVHPGPGIRCLVAGALEIQSDHATETMTPMSAWFEDANSPVQATAGPKPTSFVRAMVLPKEYAGKPTLQLLDPDDEAKPRLQTNTRFFDQFLILDTP